MSSGAYRDFLVRASEAQLLVRAAGSAQSVEMSSALAKGASVLLAAALERYLNDFLRMRCALITKDDWSELTEGEQRYLAFQVAKRIRTIAARLVRATERDTSEKARRRLKESILEGAAAFETPASWGHHRDYGMLMDGAAEPKRIDEVLGQFTDGGQGFFTILEARGRDRRAIVTTLAGMIDARHGVAHALPNNSVSAGDVKLWLRLTRLLVREVEAILWLRTTT